MTVISRLACVVALALLAGCAGKSPPVIDPATAADAAAAAKPDVYVIGPGDQLNIFVYDSPQLSMAVPVRPDGRISTPLAP